MVLNDVIELQTFPSVIPTQDSELKSLDTLSDEYLSCIESLDAALKHQFREKLQVQPALTRQLVSFQANKSRSAYRWFKYKEAFSATRGCSPRPYF
jgi:hypothetical protein